MIGFSSGANLVAMSTASAAQNTVPPPIAILLFVFIVIKSPFLSSVSFLVYILPLSAGNIQHFFADSTYPTKLFLFSVDIRQNFGVYLDFTQSRIFIGGRTSPQNESGTSNVIYDVAENCFTEREPGANCALSTLTDSP